MSEKLSISIAHLSTVIMMTKKTLGNANSNRMTCNIDTGTQKYTNAYKTGQDSQENKIG